MAIALVVLYALLIFGWIFRGRFFKAEGLRPGLVALVFALKCGLGGLYVYIHNLYFNGGDSGAYFRDGQVVYHTLFTNPLQYLMLTFGPNAMKQVPDLIAPQVEEMGYWNDVGHYMVVRFHALVSLFSMGHIAVHVMAMALLSTIGLVFLYKTVVSFSKPTNLTLLAVFGLPGTLFWTSGMHKEGLLILFVGMGLYYFSQVLQRSFSVRLLLAAIISLAFVFFVRDYAFYLLLPALAVMLVYRFKPQWALPGLALIYILVLASGPVLQSLHLPNYIDILTHKHNQFEALRTGQSHLQTFKLDGSLGAIAAHSPKALANCLFSPFKFIADDVIWYLGLALDNLLWLVLVGLLLWRADLKSLKTNPLSLPLILCSFSWFVVIGLIVPNMGAIVRYRSIPFVLLLVALALLDRHKTQDTRHEIQDIQ